jgi:hypothetical protein
LAHPLLDFLSKLHDAVKGNIQEIKVSTDASTPAILAYLSTIFDQAESCMILLQNKKFAGIEIIQRSSPEAYVHLTNLVDNPAYIENIATKFHFELARLLKEGAKGTNVYLAGLDKSQPAADALKEAEAELARLEKQGIKPMSIFDAFDLAKMADVYRSAYNSLCAEAHNDLRAVRRRHLVREGDQLNLHLYTQASHDDYERVLDGLAGILNNANLMVHKKYQTKAVEFFDRLDNELSDIRKKLVS